jgi:hypothetical protein
MLVGSIGLVLSVPITTALAAADLTPSAPDGPEPPAEPEPPHRTWDDFAPSGRPW